MSCSYLSELDDILYKTFMFEVIVKPFNIEKQDQVYTVVKITDDYDLLKEYCHSSLEDTFSVKYLLTKLQMHLMTTKLSCLSVCYLQILMFIL